MCMFQTAGFIIRKTVVTSTGMVSYMSTCMGSKHVHIDDIVKNKMKSNLRKMHFIGSHYTHTIIL